jgi:tetratricopeptide (TPR) repeat protein
MNMLKYTVRAFPFLLLFAILSFAAETWNKPAFTASPEELLQATAAMAPKDGAAVVLLLDEDRFEIDAENRATYIQHRIYKVFDPTEAGAFRSLSAPFAPWYQARPRLEARVVDASGKVFELDPATISESPLQNSDNEVYSDRRIVQAPLPGLGAGAVVEYRVTLTDTAPFSRLGIGHNIVLGSFAQVAHARAVIQTPLSLEFRYKTGKLPAGVTPTVMEKDGLRILTVEATDMTRPDAVEDFLPFDLPRWPTLRISTGHDWQSLARDYSETVEKQLAGADVKAWVQKAIAGKTSREQVLQALIEELHRNIRYTGIEFGEAAMVPRSPAEVLKRKYGDCKDKSALLIAMLREAGIPAHMALLLSGDSEDVDPALPAMNIFDHAIVFIPGDTHYWVDATDEFARLGALHSAIQGRRALIAAPDTTGLVLIDELPSSASRTVETREVTLPESGFASIRETTEAYGPVEASYRSSYANADDKNTRDQLEGYVKNTYYAERMTRFSPSSNRDFTRPFSLVLETDRSKRGKTEVDTAYLAIPITDIAGRLPRYLWEAEPTQEEQSAHPDDPLKKPRQNDLVLPSAFVTEWHYRIRPASGFAPRELPPAVEKKLGPALFTASFSRTPEGLVNADFRFDSVKRRYSAAEVRAMKKALQDWSKEPVLFLNFDHAGKLLIREGKYREAMEAYRISMREHPKSGVHHSRLAMALLSLGLGDVAREEARAAVAVEPSAQAYRVLALVAEHNSLGKQLAPGFDRDAAEAAWRKVVELDPKDDDAKARLAHILEYDQYATRYSNLARMDEALAGFDALQDKLEDLGYRGFPPYDLMYTGQFERLREWLKTAPANPTFNAMAVVASAVLDGPQPAIAEAGRRSVNAEGVATVLNDAAGYLANLRRYDLVTELSKAALKSNPSSRDAAIRANIYARVKRWDDFKLDPADPASAVRAMLFTMYKVGSQPQDLDAFSPRYELDPRIQEKRLRAHRRSLENVRVSIRNSGLAYPVLPDIILSLAETSVQGDPGKGSLVTFKSPGANAKRFLVTLDDGRPEIYSVSDDASIGALVLDRIRSGDLRSARQFLDWVREENPKGGGEDPYSGRPFGRFWTQGDPADPEAMKLAAVALLLGLPAAEEHLPYLVALRDRESDTARRRDLDLLLASLYADLKMYKDLLPVAERLLADEPRSARAFSLLTGAYRGLGLYAEWEKAALDRLRLLPDDAFAQRSYATSFAIRGDLTRARELQRKFAASPKGTPGDRNQFAWWGLFAGATSKDDLEFINEVYNNNSDAGFVHTIAAVQADLGNIAEARQLLDQYVQSSGSEGADDNAWLVIGRMAQRLGLIEAARAAYQRIEPLVPGSDDRFSSWELGQLYLAQLPPAPEPPMPPARRQKSTSRKN